MAALVALPVAAANAQINAQPGFYIGAGGGAVGDWDTPAGVSTSTGWAVGGKMGYDFVGPRVELEVGYGEVPTKCSFPGRP